MNQLLTVLFIVSFTFIHLTPVKSEENLKECMLTVNGIGDFALHSISSRFIGTAYIHNERFPDLFMVGDNIYPGCFRYEYVTREPSGTPVFKRVQEIKLPYVAKKAIPSALVQKGKNIYLFWCSSDQFNYGLYNVQKAAFEKKASAPLPKIKYGPSAISVNLSDDGKVHVIFSARDKPGSSPPEGKQAANCSLYNGAGIWQGTFPYEGIYSFAYPKLLKGPPGQPVLLSQTPSEILKGCQSLCPVTYEEGNQKGIISGANMGVLYYFRWDPDKNRLKEKRHLVGKDHNTLRHPDIWATPIVYPNASGKYEDILATGEGGAFFYHFTGNFAPSGKPVYESPVPLKEIHPILYGGSVSVPTLIDWDHDGSLDIISGNSAGEVLFFKNAGSNHIPNFLSGIPIKASGEIIHIQPDYGEDIQGPGESRWGYAGSNVFDWNGDGFPDILMNDSRSRHTVFMGSATGKLLSGNPLYLNDLALRGTWRCRPGVGILDHQYVYITLDNDNDAHLYYQLDNFNLIEGKKIRLTDGTSIHAKNAKNGATGRVRFEIVDWDGDGIKDLLLGTNNNHSIPNPVNGIPLHNPDGEKCSTVLFLKNTGTEKNPVYAYPRQLKYKGEIIKLGHHACSPAAGYLGPVTDGLPNLLIADEKGSFYLLNRKYISW